MSVKQEPRPPAIIPHKRYPIPSRADGAVSGSQHVGSGSDGGTSRSALGAIKAVGGDWDWLVGDTLISSKPTSGQPWGWKCTVSGKAGAGAVFTSMGTLA